MVSSISPSNQMFTGFAQKQLGSSSLNMLQVTQRLSSGLRINQAKDDAAGLAVAQGFLSQLNALNMSDRNVNDGISLTQTADAYSANLNDSLMRMSELAVQSANGTYSDDQRQLMQQEFSALQSLVQDTIDGAEFNGQPLLSADGTLSIQAGAESSDQVEIPTTNLAAAGTSMATVLDSNFSIATAADASSAMNTLGQAINEVSGARASMGASANRLDMALSGIRSEAEARAASYGRIMDADFARETSRQASFQIRQQSGIAMMGQAMNMHSSFVMGLLGR